MTENKRFENRLNRDIKKFNALNPVWDNEKEDALNVFEMIDEMNELQEEKEQLTKENIELKEELHEFKEYVFSDEEILCYSCVNCVSKGIYEVDCSEKGKVDVHSSCFLYWKNEVKDIGYTE